MLGSFTCRGRAARSRRRARRTQGGPVGVGAEQGEQGVGGVVVALVPAGGGDAAGEAEPAVGPEQQHLPGRVRPQPAARRPPSSQTGVTPGMAAASRHRPVCSQPVGQPSGRTNSTNASARPGRRASTCANSCRLARVQGQCGWASSSRVGRPAAGGRPITPRAAASSAGGARQARPASAGGATGRPCPRRPPPPRGRTPPRRRRVGPAADWVWCRSSGRGRGRASVRCIGRRGRVVYLVLKESTGATPFRPPPLGHGPAGGGARPSAGTPRGARKPASAASALPSSTGRTQFRSREGGGPTDEVEPDGRFEGEGGKGVRRQELLKILEARARVAAPRRIRMGRVSRTRRGGGDSSSHSSLGRTSKRTSQRAASSFLALNLGCPL